MYCIAKNKQHLLQCSSFSTVDVTVSIAPVSGTNTVGETYSLKCSVTVVGSTEQPVISWTDDNIEISSSNGSTSVSATTMTSEGIYSSILTFDPLSELHAGHFACKAMAGGVVKRETIALSVNREFVGIHV